jgi:GcrA cell cycle regulator
MKRVWTPEHIARLEELARSGASAARASAALRRTISSVRIKANSLGTPFPSVRQAKTDRAAREAEAKARQEALSGLR